MACRTQAINSLSLFLYHNLARRSFTSTIRAHICWTKVLRDEKARAVRRPAMEELVFVWTHTSGTYIHAVLCKGYHCFLPVLQHLPTDSAPHVYDFKFAVCKSKVTPTGNQDEKSLHRWKATERYYCAYTTGGKD